jgi:hypothetical protein
MRSSIVLALVSLSLASASCFPEPRRQATLIDIVDGPPAPTIGSGQAEDASTATTTGNDAAGTGSATVGEADAARGAQVPDAASGVTGPSDGPAGPVVICGNGRVDPDETCDPPSDCPRTCPEINCTRQRLTGTPEQCNVRCEEEKITTCASGDKCCPRTASPACTALNDSECAAVCNNNALEAGETCEPRSDCQARADACRDDRDTLRTRTGEVGACTFACIESKRSCTAGDGQCPTGCTAVTDQDCDGCGNSQIEPGETCDPPSTCPTTCPDVTCTRQRLTGTPDQCNVRCEGEPTTTCTSGDRCCPRGTNPVCTALNDSECSAVCNNSAIEAGETCEPRSDCQARATACRDDRNTLRTPTGDVASCTFACIERPRPCVAGDGQCPASCTARTDPECTNCVSNADCENGFACQNNRCSTTQCATGFTRCGAQCVPSSQVPPEQCNGVDDNCNGLVDDGNITQTCSSTCGGGQERCTNGRFTGCTAPQPRADGCCVACPRCQRCSANRLSCDPNNGASCITAAGQNGTCNKRELPAELHLHSLHPEQQVPERRHELQPRRNVRGNHAKAEKHAL